MKRMLACECPGYCMNLYFVPADGASLELLTIIEHWMVLRTHDANKLISRKLVEEALTGVLLHADHEDVALAFLALEGGE